MDGETSGQSTGGQERHLARKGSAVHPGWHVPVHHGQEALEVFHHGCVRATGDRSVGHGRLTT